MKFEAFIHNDDPKCFHMVIQRTQKMVMMGCINFEDEALIKRQQAGKKRNVTDAGEDDVVEAKIQPFTKVQEMTKAQPRAMEIEMRE
jgi:hypothetical protein